MSRIPLDWEIRTLDELTQQDRPISYGVVQTGDPVENGVPCVRVVDLTNGNFNPKSMITTSHEISQSYKRTILQADDLMIALRGEIGFTAKVPYTLVGANLTRGVALIAPNQTFASPDFLLQVLHSDFVHKEILDRVNGSALKEIPIGNLRKVPIPLPPLPEQRKIAAILSTWDEAISRVDALIDALKRRKKALMQLLLTGEVRFPGFDGAWEETRIGDSANLTAGGTPSTRRLEFWGGDVRWMNSGDIHQKRIFEVGGRITAEGLANSSAKILPRNSVLIALAGQGKTRGTVAINEVELSTNQSVAAIIPDPKLLNYEYLFYVLDSRYEELRRLSTGDGGRGGLNLQILKDIWVPNPTIDEQTRIADTLKSADEPIDCLLRYIDELQKQKRALMQQLLNGAIRVQGEE